MTEHQIRHLIEVLEGFQNAMGKDVEQKGFTLGGEKSVLNILKKQITELSGVSQLLSQYRLMR